MRRLLIGLVFCVGCMSPEAYYIYGDRQTYRAVAPEFVQYVREDPVLTDEQKQRRYATVDSWEARLVEAESSQEPELGAE